MAFTTAQVVKIRKYLGWPVWRTASTEIESAITLAGADAAQQAEIESILVNLASIEVEIANLHSLALASKAEETELNPRRYADLRAAGRRECTQLASAFDCAIRADVFAAGGLISGPLPAG